MYDDYHLLMIKLFLIKHISIFQMFFIFYFSVGYTLIAKCNDKNGWFFFLHYLGSIFAILWNLHVDVLQRGSRGRGSRSPIPPHYINTINLYASDPTPRHRHTQITRSDLPWRKKIWIRACFESILWQIRDI